MQELDFISLHKEKLNVIFENIEVLSNIKESDTQLPPKFFKDINDDIIKDYLSKMSILNKNTKFVIKELKKDFRQLRKTQKRKHRELRRQFIETTVYILPAKLLHHAACGEAACGR